MMGENILKTFKHKLESNPKTQNNCPLRDFLPNLKQDLSGWSGFLRQLRSKSCFKMSV